MKLTDLEAEFVRWEDRVISSEEARRRYGIVGGVDGSPQTFIPWVETLAEAQGVVFDCPVCRSPGHSIQVAFQGRGVLPHHGTRGMDGQPTRWHVVSGTGLHDLSLSPSIDLTPWNPTCWHGHITNGEIA